MPATEHATIPKPISTPKDDPPSPRKSAAAEPLRPLQPTSLHVAIDPIKPKDVLSETGNKSPLESKKSVTSSAPNSEPEPEEEVIIYSQKYTAADGVESPTRMIVDTDTFNQILELDEDEDSHDFSQPMVWDYFEQAEKTFTSMDDAFAKEDLNTLSSLGHFLKGSSAALGLSRVQHTCEEIQHVGDLRDEKSEKNLKPTEALKRMGKLLKRVKIEYKEAQAWMKNFYGEVAHE